MAFIDKAKWVLGILLVFILIVTTNLIDRNNFIRVRDSVVTLYEDRLLAKDLIYEIAKAVHEKEVALALPDSTFYTDLNSKVNTGIQTHIDQFEQTKLTVEEGEVFNNLKRDFEGLRNAETALIASGFQQKTTAMNFLSGMKENLDRLAEIQVDEGGRQMAISKRAVDTVELFTQIEIYFLVFLAIVIQIIVMYKPRET